MKYENTFKAIDQILWKEQELERREAESSAREKELAMLIKMGRDAPPRELRQDFSGVRRIETSHITTSV